MEVKCSYCRRKIADSMVICPYCGAENENYNPIFNKEENTSVSAKNPQTIEELKEWYNSMNLPSPEVTRFFIGKDYSGPMAFGIYKSDLTGDYIVYKNKKDRSRAIRYEGPDENYAVNELYLKLKSEIASQKTRN